MEKFINADYLPQDVKSLIDYHIGKRFGAECNHDLTIRYSENGLKYACSCVCVVNPTETDTNTYTIYFKLLMAKNNTNNISITEEVYSEGVNGIVRVK